MIYLIGLIAFGVASTWAGLASSSQSLIGARFLQAVGAACMLPATLALIRITFIQRRERNIAVSVWACLSLVGAVLGPLVGGLLLEHFHWGAIFLVNLPIVVVAFIGAVYTAPHGNAVIRQALARWDWVSSVIALVALSSLVFAIKQAAASPSVFLLSASISTAAFAIWIFIRRQLRLTDPLVDLTLFRNKVFTAGVCAAAIVTFATGGLLLSVSQRYQWVTGYSPLESGLLVSAVFIGTLPSGLLGGAMLHKLGFRLLLAGGLGIAGAGALSLLFLGATGGINLVGALILTGLGLGATVSVASSAIVDSAPPHQAGMAASIEEVSYELGSLFAVAVLGSLMTAVYHAQIELPAGVPEEARLGMAEAVELARRSGDTAVELLDAASEAFDRAYSVALFTIASVLTLGATAIAVGLTPEAGHRNSKHVP